MEQFDKEAESKAVDQQTDENVEMETKEESSRKAESQIGFESEDESCKHYQSKVPRELNEEEESSVLDDNCSVDTVIENKIWKDFA